MSHGKKTKRGNSLYLDKWNPYAKKYINTCKLCGCRGYSPAIDEEDFSDTVGNGAIRYELKRTLTKLELDGFGRCADCAKVHDKSEE